MSNAITKAERSKAKDIRQGVTPQREHYGGKKKKVAKPYHVRVEWFGREWSIHRCADLETAIKLKEKTERRFGNREVWITYKGVKQCLIPFTN